MAGYRFREIDDLDIAIQFFDFLSLRQEFSRPDKSVRQHEGQRRRARSERCVQRDPGGIPERRVAQDDIGAVHSTRRKLAVERGDFTDAPSVPVRVIGEHERQNRGFPRGGADPVAANTAGHEFVALLVAPPGRQQIAQTADRGNEKGSGAGEGFVDPKGVPVMPVELQPGDGIFGKLTGSAMSAQTPSGFRPGQDFSIDVRQTFGRDVGQVDPAAQKFPGGGNALRAGRRRFGKFPVEAIAGFDARQNGIGVVGAPLESRGVASVQQGLGCEQAEQVSGRQRITVIRGAGRGFKRVAQKTVELVVDLALDRRQKSGIDEVQPVSGIDGADALRPVNSIGPPAVPVPFEQSRHGFDGQTLAAPGQSGTANFPKRRVVAFDDEQGRGPERAMPVRKRLRVACARRDDGERG